MATQITEPKKLVERQLQSMLYVERTLASEILPQFLNHVQDAELKENIEHHLEETRAHVRNVEQAIDLCGCEKKPQESKVLEGLRTEHDELMTKLQPGHLMDLFHTGVIAKNEHVEIAAYNGLIEQLDALGEEEAANLLRENLDQEEEALKKVEKGMKKLLKSKVKA